MNIFQSITGFRLQSSQPVRTSRMAASATLALALLGSALPASAASLVLTNTDPIPGADDVYNFTGGASDNQNVNGGTDSATYVAADQTTKGQIFTVGSSAGGYLLSDVWVRHCGYTGSVIGNGTWWNMAAGAVITIRVTDPTKAGQAGFALASETYTATGTENAGVRWTGGGNSLGDNMWLHFTLATPVSVAANKQYGIELTATTAGGGNYFEWLGTSNNAYSGGVAYSGQTAATLGNIVNTNIGDRVFLVQLGHVVPAVPPTLAAPLRFVPVGQSVQVTATIPAIVNASSAVTVVLTNNNPGLISLPGGASKLTLNFAAGATNSQTFSVQVLAAGEGSLSVVTNASFTDASILIGTPIVAQEPFEYDPATQPYLDQANGGTGFGAAWAQASSADTIVAGLAYGSTSGLTSLVTSSNAAAVSGNGNEAFRQLAGTYGGVGGGTVYISFLVQAPGGLSDWGGLSFFSGTSAENLFMGEVYGLSANHTWGFLQGGTVRMNYSGSVTPGDQVDFLVYRIDFPATNGGTALVSFYANPPLNNNEPASPTGSANVSNFTFDHLRLGTAGTLNFDEIRVGTQWTNVMKFVGPPDLQGVPVPTLTAPARFAPVGQAVAVTVSIPTNSPRPVTMTINNDNPTAFSLSSTNAATVTLTFPNGGTNVQTLNVQVLAGGLANLTVVSNATINTAMLALAAQVSASEEFQYAAGTEVLAGSTGGSGFDVNAWTGGGSVITPGLTYPGLVTSSNAASLDAAVAGTGDRILFPIAGGYGGAGGGTVWISFLVRGAFPTDSFQSAGLALLSGTAQPLFLGLDTTDGSTTWGFTGQGQGQAVFPNSVAPSTNADLLVYRLDFPASADGLVNVTFYANPAVGATPPAETGSGAVHYFTFDGIRIRSSFTNDFDELRLGGSWAEVVPVALVPVVNAQRLSATQIQISWSAALTGYELQSSSSLTSGWATAGLSVATVNGQSVATDTITGTAKFYRLHKL